MPGILPRRLPEPKTRKLSPVPATRLFGATATRPSPSPRPSGAGGAVGTSPESTAPNHWNPATDDLDLQTQARSPPGTTTMRGGTGVGWYRRLFGRASTRAPKSTQPYAVNHVTDGVGVDAAALAQAKAELEAAQQAAEDRLVARLTQMVDTKLAILLAALKTELHLHDQLQA